MDSLRIASHASFWSILLLRWYRDELSIRFCH